MFDTIDKILFQEVMPEVDILGEGKLKVEVKVEPEVKVETETEVEEEELDDEGNVIVKPETKVEEEETLTRADYKTLTTEFPELFKKYPDLKQAFFREQKFTELFPTIEAAKEAAEAQENFESIVESVTNGDVDKFLTDLKTEDAGAVKKFATGFLPALVKNDKDLYLDIVSPIVGQFIKNVYEFGKKATTEAEKNNIMNAAKIVRKILFEGEYDDIENEVKSNLEIKSDKDKKDEEDRNRDLQSKYSIVYADVTKACYSLLDKELAKGFEDLKDNPAILRMAIKEVKDLVLAEMEKDESHLARMSGLWKRERRSGFNGTNKSSFTTTFLSKAKTLIPKHRLEIRKELKLSDKKVETKDEKINRPEAGKEAKVGDKVMTAERVRKEGLSSRDVFGTT